MIPGTGNNIEPFWAVWSIQVLRQGVEGGEGKERHGRIVEMAVVCHGACPGPLATSFEPSPDAEHHLIVLRPGFLRRLTGTPSVVVLALAETFCWRPSRRPTGS